MLSRCCDGCGQRRRCARIYVNFEKGEFIACPVGEQIGSKLLIDA